MQSIDTSQLGWHHPITGRKQGFDLIPTWQKGMPQQPDADYANLIKEGYSKHAIIHACISLLSSSAAIPPLHLFRHGSAHGAEEEHVEDHPLLRLIERPNEWQSEAEFRELLLTHLLITGNAYVELLRSGGLVRSMGLLRPDRVAINPAASDSREDDVYVYTVGDRRRLIPQPDLIHFRLPNPRNDFYGLSPIEAATREANLDIDLTLFAKAFFENAGVPFGMLTIQGRRASPEEKEEIKTAWRRAFNRATTGVRKAFELLLLNADEAKYQQMGGMPKDLEMLETRHQVESRICMAFRVPPIMVAARVGLEFATYANFEAAEKVLWRYGVAYYLTVVRDRMNLELVPEFQRSQDSGLRLDYDLSAVPALAEDNTDKLKVVADLVRSSGFTSNQALTLVGLNPVEGGDIYVRTLTSVVERSLNGGDKGMLIEPRPWLKGQPRTSQELREDAEAFLADLKQQAARRLAPAIEAIRERVMSRMVIDLRKFFEEQARQIIQRIIQIGRQQSGRYIPQEERDSIFERRLMANFGSELPEDLPESQVKLRGVREADIFPRDQDETLLLRLNGHYLAIDRTIWETMRDTLGLTVEYDEAGPVAQLLLQRGAVRVTAINDVTRSAIRDVLALSEERGYSLFQTVNGVADDGFPGMRAVVEETYLNRAEAVARTEAGFATNDASLARYAEAGVTEVEIIDGTDDPCCADRNGTRVAVEERPDLCHPNCTIVVVPVVG